jgi:hypothetical protein
MRTALLTGILLVLLALPAGGGAAPLGEGRAPVAHEDLARTLDELARRLHGLGAQWREHFAPMMTPWPERPLVSLILSYRVELGLSAAQVEALERIRSEFQREAIRRDADIRIAEEELALLLRADAADMPRVEATVREIERLRGGLRIARIRAMEQGKTQLTPEQRQKLRALLAPPPPPPRSDAPPGPPPGRF